MPGLFIWSGALHPSLKIILLVLLAAAVQHTGLYALALAGCVLMFLAARWHIGLLRKLLFRSRWLLLTLFMIYAFTTPGEYLSGWESYGLTYEGLHQGALQAIRLIIMLAGLALLLGTTGRDALMAGIYGLISPLRVFKISPDRFTARLWLTLHYVELERPQHKLPFWQRFEQVSAQLPEQINHVRFEVPHFVLRDWLVLMAATGLVLWSIA
jgi:energy-coupling factor transporter transmembrane protein EcfT